MLTSLLANQPVASESERERDPHTEYYVPSNGVRLMCGVRLMVNKTNHFNTDFVLKTPPTVVYISFHVYLTETQLPM